MVDRDEPRWLDPHHLPQVIIELGAAVRLHRAVGNFRIVHHDNRLGVWCAAPPGAQGALAGSRPDRREIAPKKLVARLGARPMDEP